MLAAGVTRMPEDVGAWHAADHVLAFGALYFGALALAEASGGYEVLGPRLWRAYRRQRKSG
jgi:hypothetical protein